MVRSYIDCSGPQDRVTARKLPLGTPAAGPPLAELLGTLTASIRGRKKTRSRELKSSPPQCERTVMQSKEAPRRKATSQKKCHGQRDSSCGTTDISAQGRSGVQPTDSYKQYHWHCNDVGNRPSPQPYRRRGPEPYPGPWWHEVKEHQTDRWSRGMPVIQNTVWDQATTVNQMAASNPGMEINWTVA
ncbi:hypothetical protein Anapl_05003 [Anas platyrhynchos]|uniref:Uncharacterized protein n=1 Tax=Anas platyrhynchos TaxID=8839 RepID=R0K3R6_ANAPL|nr:hypothetical protein Anapl_05003 [Anas platyrhynchos]